ncbi:MAG: hypothetical protein KKC68_07065 [Candidatus Thermoplasmatota archaeon]|nr:hypothetical protein [Candidatus Thermoplasmatota archaeon]
MRHVTIVCVFMLLLLPFTISASSNNTSNPFNPQDIDLIDLAYNRTNTIAVQWWYFDAILSHNYSTVIGLFHLGFKNKIGFYFIRINMYQNGTFLGRNIQFIPMKQITYQIDPPVFIYKDITIYGAKHDYEGKINVSLNFEMKDFHVNLSFIETAKGWKGFTGRGWWACPLPKAIVNGRIYINNQSILVTGVGYHEHAWMVQSTHRNWKWGKFSSESTNIIFSKNMKNIFEEDIFLAVVNIGENIYVGIHRNNIEYYHTKYMFDHGKLIPIESKFLINQDNISVNVTFRSETVHYTSLILLKYWRFHMCINGTITIDNKLEEVDDKEIMEYLYIL